jgi:hypothetical protein
MCHIPHEVIDEGVLSEGEFGEGTHVDKTVREGLEAVTVKVETLETTKVTNVTRELSKLVVTKQQNL